MKYKSALVTDLSGSIGGMTASRNRGGGYFRSRVNVLQPQTCRQNTIRAIFGELASTFAGLTSTERAAWDAAAEAYSPAVQDFCGESHPTGQNLFIGQNTLRKQLDALGSTSLGVLTVPPTNLIQEPPVVTITPPTLTGDQFTVTLDFVEAIPDGINIATYVGIPQNPGVNFYGGPWQLGTTGAAAGAATDDVISVDLTSTDEWYSQYIPIEGKRIPLRFVNISAAGDYLNSQAFQCLSDVVEEVTTV